MQWGAAVAPESAAAEAVTAAYAVALSTESVPLTLMQAVSAVTHTSAASRACLFASSSGAAVASTAVAASTAAAAACPRVRATAPSATGGQAFRGAAGWASQPLPGEGRRASFPGRNGIYFAALQSSILWHVFQKSITFLLTPAKFYDGNIGESACAFCRWQVLLSMVGFTLDPPVREGAPRGGGG
jgi:hypothetical protein